jgi:hypothetical protein
LPTSSPDLDLLHFHRNAVFCDGRKFEKGSSVDAERGNRDWSG